MPSRHDPAPRLAPDRPLPPYRYLTGETPHPTRDPAGHSYGVESAPPAPDPDRWAACEAYLYGIDLFNRGYYWEAHEAWEGLWHACGRQGRTADYLQGLIALAAAGFKAREGIAAGVRRHGERAKSLFAQVATTDHGGETRTSRFMGLEIPVLIQYARSIVDRAAVLAAEANRGGPDALGFSLWPEADGAED